MSSVTYDNCISMACSEWRVRQVKYLNKMVFFFITSGVFPAGQTNVDPTIGLAMYEVTSGFSHGSRVQ